MTREEELELLISEQAKDDASMIVNPPVNGQHWAGSLDTAAGDDATMGDAYGIVYDFETGEQEIISFLRPRRGHVLGHVARAVHVHGTTTGYSRGCRCDPCTEAMVSHVRVWKAKQPPWHGTIGGYTNHSCRCSRCTRAWRGYQRRQWRLKKATKHGKRSCACGCGKRFTPKRIDNIYYNRKCAQRQWKRNKVAA